MKLTLWSCLLLVLFAQIAQTGPESWQEFGSDLVNEGNTRSGLNVAIQPVSVWQVPPSGVTWVSYADTGAGGFSPPNTNSVPGSPTASFWEGVFIRSDDRPGQHHGEHRGYLTVWADDTVQVGIFNSNYPQGKLLAKARPVLDEHCSKFKTGCEPKEGRKLNLTPYLAHGVNVLWFDVYQLGGDGFGLLYQGKYESGAN